MMEVAVAVRAQMSHGNFRLLTISPKFHNNFIRPIHYEASSRWKKWQARALRRKIRAAEADLTSARKCKLLPAIKVKYHSYVLFFLVIVGKLTSIFHYQDFEKEVFPLKIVSCLSGIRIAPTQPSPPVPYGNKIWIPAGVDAILTSPPSSAKSPKLANIPPYVRLPKRGPIIWPRE